MCYDSTSTNWRSFPFTLRDMTIKSEKLDRPLGISLIMMFSLLAVMILIQIWRFGFKDPVGSILLIATFLIAVGAGRMIDKMM